MAEEVLEDVSEHCKDLILLEMEDKEYKQPHFIKKSEFKKTNLD